MRHLASEQSRNIFRQIAAVPGPAAVKTVIENHDAWLHNQDAVDELDAMLRRAVECRHRTDEQTRRIAAQRQALSAVAVVLPRSLANAG
jgi:hypothetical protein